MSENYKIEKLDIKSLERRTGAWSAYGGPAITGTEHIYEVKDANYRTMNKWTIAVRVPNAKHGEIIVQPILTPGKKVWAGIDRKPIVLVYATKHPNRGLVYCKLNLASGKTKKAARRGERDALPKWFDFLKSKMRLKNNVKTTYGNDFNVQVAVIKPDDHETMIALYFALKVWVMAEGFSLDDN
jgi:hypothetical protein